MLNQWFVRHGRDNPFCSLNGGKLRIPVKAASRTDVMAATIPL